MSLKFGTDGVRGVANTELTPELVVALGRAAARVLERPTPGPRAGAEIGRLAVMADADRSYLDHLVVAMEGRTLEGLKVALDCGNGVASGIAGEAYRRLGAEVLEINCQPDGMN